MKINNSTYCGAKNYLKSYTNVINQKFIFKSKTRLMTKLKRKCNSVCLKFVDLQQF